MTPLGQLRFRFATTDDIPALVPMINAAFVVEWFLKEPRTSEGHLSELMKTGRVLLAENATRAPLASVYIERHDTMAYLGVLAVDPRYQGQGLSRRLLQTAEEALRAEGVARLEITVLNLRPELMPLYHRLGFVETSTEPFHSPELVADGFECHCIRMAKTLREDASR